MYSILFVILIVGFFLIIQRSKMGKKLNAITTAIFLILALIGVLLQIGFIEEKVESTFKDSNVWAIVLLVVIIGGGIILYMMFTIAVVKGVDLIAQRIRERDISIKIFEKSRLYLGGMILSQIKYTGVLYRGYFLIRLRSPFNENVTLFKYYDYDTKKGVLKKFSKNRSFNCRIDIPKNFIAGEFKIDIEMRDVVTFFGSKDDYLIKAFSLTIQVLESPINQIISIHKITNPKLKQLDKIKQTTDITSGWICVKLHNSSDFEIHDSFGKIITDIGEFSLYDYELYLKNGEQNLDNYAIFSINHNSTKRLYANIQTTNHDITAQVDFGNREVIQKLSLVSFFADN